MAQQPRARRPVTALACALSATAFLTTIGYLTAGFEHWTFEALRRQAAIDGAMRWPAMDLVAASGQPLHLPAGGNGQVLLVDFIYTSCESVCQSLGAEFFRAQQQIQQQGSAIRLVSISIDPARDTPAALAAYGLRHHAQAPLWTLASPRTVGEGRQARRQLGVIAIDDGLGGFAHNGALHVVDPHGHIAGIFDTADWQQALALARQLEAARP